MGAPQPGQIPDNIFLSIQQLKLAKLNGAAVPVAYTAKAGAMLYRPIAAKEFWSPIAGKAAALTAAEVSRGIAQTRVDLISPANDGEVAVEAMAPPSYIYALMGGNIFPENITTINAAGEFITLATKSTGLDVGRYSRRAIDQAGSNKAIDTDIGIIKLGVS